MVKSFLINNNSDTLSATFGVVAEVLLLPRNGTAILCILSPEDVYEDYRAVIRETKGLKTGDCILFEVYDEFDGLAQDDESSCCIRNIQKINDTVFLTPLERLALI